MSEKWKHNDPMPEIDIQDYIDAISGKGPKAIDWNDKPHRLIYDLCGHIQLLNNKN